MPRRHKSDPRNQDIVLGFLRSLHGLDRVVEVGIGYGEYGELLRAEFPQLTLLGIEVWTPYLSDPQATIGGYDMLETCDVRHLPDRVWNRCDLTLWIDGPEHLDPPDSLAQLQRFQRLSRLGVVTACPIIDYPQGAVNGNPHETHRSQWSVAGMESIGATVLATNDLTGVFHLPHLDI